MSKPKNLLQVEKYCHFCMNAVNDIDYKDSMQLRRFISGQSKIVPRRRSGVCTKHQRFLATAIKRARYMAVLPYLPK